MKHNCKICNKEYSSYKSLWNHNKKFHENVNTMIIHHNTFDNTSIILDNTSIIPDNTSIIQDNSEKICKKFNCKKCNRQFNNYQNRWKHEKTCKKTDEIKATEDKKLELELVKEEKEKIKEERLLKSEEAKILELKLKLQNSNKVDKVTLKKLNKILLDRHNRIKNSTINTNSNNTQNNNNIQNNIVNNTYQLIGFGKEENLPNLLTNKEKQMILNSKYGSLEKLIEIVHCGNYNQFKNIIITNLKDNYMYKYDDKKGVFILSTKAEVLKTLVDYRMGDLEVIYNDFLENNRIDERTKKSLEKFINEINYETDKFTNTDGTSYENYRQYKISEIKVLLFNNQDKIANDISLFLSTEETEIPIENI